LVSFSFWKKKKKKKAHSGTKHPANYKSATGESHRKRLQGGESQKSNDNSGLKGRSR
jgi:hypothetical protein